MNKKSPTGYYNAVLSPEKAQNEQLKSMPCATITTCK